MKYARVVPRRVPGPSGARTFSISITRTRGRVPVFPGRQTRVVGIAGYPFFRQTNPGSAGTRVPGQPTTELFTIYK